MTRDEALKIMSRIWGPNAQHDLAIGYVDAFVALGMLKLDEPKPRRDRITRQRDFMLDNFGLGCYAPVEFDNMLRVYGLQIVEIEK